MSAPPSSFIQRAQNFVFSKDFVKYICSTHFWGPVSNFGIPVAAILDLKKDPNLISGPMTGSLVIYSLVFMKYATAVTPWNPLLFGCHAVNEVAQLGQAFRWTNYWYFGGHERAIANAPKTEEPVAAPVKKE
ncbi:similar to Saccharomyces cerevisiae YGL080W FMP37 Putative protein of unknown function [Geotrichum candidum]|uniref:Mitochondrial pyruvate carrier n=1 Tax=Geotrichum candidum TaxID=1173061 RepID=A0A0J9XJH1_GEOCN|nr:similar to Saccharomyces cerevisiae YGL080W FMP37 Putative protein of unknown function [Geotrichum candidum]